MNPWESLIDHHPALIDYYFTHLNVHKDRIVAVIVEEKSLISTLLDDPKSVCRYINPLLGNEVPLEHTVCSMILPTRWMVVGFSIITNEGLPKSVLYLTPITNNMDVPQSLQPGMTHTYTLNTH